MVKAISLSYTHMGMGIGVNSYPPKDMVTRQFFYRMYEYEIVISCTHCHLYFGQSVTRVAG
jgi:hypothetical protein